MTFTAKLQPSRGFKIILLVAVAMVPTGLFIAYHPPPIDINTPLTTASKVVQGAPGVLAGLGVIALGSLGVAFITRAPAPRMSTYLPFPRPRWSLPAAAAALAGVVCSCALCANLGAERFVWFNGLLFITALALWGFVVHLWDRGKSRRHALKAIDYVIAVGCGLFSITINCIGLVRWNFSWIGDEGAFFFAALGIVNGIPFNIFDLTFVYESHPVLDTLYQATALRLFGADIWGWRIGEALVLAAVVVIVYLVGRVFFDQLTGTIAALVVGTSHYLFAFTRIGYNNLHALFWSTLAILMVALAWRTRRAIFTYFAGCAVGMCLYTFFVAILIGPILAFLLGLPFLKRPTRRQVTAGVLMIVAFTMVILPGLISTPFSELQDVAQRESQREQAAVDPVGTFSYSLTRSFISFFVNHQWYNHYVGAATLDPLSAGLAAIGLAGALLEVRRRGERTVLVWFGLGLFLIALTNYLPYPQLTRLLFLLPPIALLAGLGGRSIYRAVTRVFGAPRWVGCTVLTFIAAGVVFLNLVILHHTSPKRLQLDPKVLAFKAAMDHSQDHIVFAYVERDQNLALMLRCYPEIEPRVAVLGLDDLEVIPKPFGQTARAPIFWTSEKTVYERLEKLLGSSYRVEVDSPPGARSSAWLFLPDDPENSSRDKPGR